MNYTQDPQMVQFETTVKALLSLLPCLFFLYVNGVMVFTLLKKPIFLDSPRYVLFGHLLFTDSLLLLLTVLLYILALTVARMITFFCIIVSELGAITVKISPLNLAVMSLERYVAICFPLRHAAIATVRTTGIAITVMWIVASLDSFTQVFLLVSLENTDFTVQRYCRKSDIFRQQVYVTLTLTFTIVNFVLVSVIIIFTYVAIVVTVRSTSSCVHNANKAHKTVLLHLLQLCLCLISTMFTMISSNDMLTKNPDIAAHIRYILFLVLIVFPKCLSPLIYGLRDQNFSHVFKYYFTFGFKSTVKPFPRS
ncbi:odorant receptor 131-2-like [Odontesthes bonariensis]|uniref:odorant receptor 131-2-like n=1 Tax=Odontesthes bonariensis TaxID=219752 RepID=UPI003F58F2DF